MERKFKVTENGGVVVNKPVEEYKMKQKNYVIREENINKVKAWAKEFGIKSDSEMLDEIILAFEDMLEIGKKAKKEEVATAQEEPVKPSKSRKSNNKTGV